MKDQAVVQYQSALLSAENCESAFTLLGGTENSEEKEIHDEGCFDVVMQGKEHELGYLRELENGRRISKELRPIYWQILADKGSCRVLATTEGIGGKKRAFDESLSNSADSEKEDYEEAVSGDGKRPTRGRSMKRSRSFSPPSKANPSISRSTSRTSNQHTKPPPRNPKVLRPPLKSSQSVSQGNGVNPASQATPIFKSNKLKKEVTEILISFMGDWKALGPR
ncbi:MAG: hypothetical protein M1827_007231 [Pycnora praestabilis]|nr:MAG: hypothetical protein M1827_007231 [Pycnora praestabilis]